LEEILSKSNKHLFQTSLVIHGKTICQATGASKKESQQLVSKIACQQIDSTPDFLLQLTQEPTEISAPPENQLPDTEA